MAEQLQVPFSTKLPHPVYFRTARLRTAASYPRHHHPWGEFVYAFTGVMELELAGSHYLAPPQYGIWLPPDVEHRGMNRSEASHCSLYLTKALCRGLPKTTCALAVSPLVKSLLEHLREHQVAYPRTSAERRLMRVLIDQLSLAPPQGSYLPMSEDPLLGEVLRALVKAPADGRSLAEWAHQVHTTERTLERRCQQHLGLSFSEWRQRLRVVKALAMLEEGCAVEVVALELGYSTASAFIAMFRRMTGTTPDKLRGHGLTAS
ncbi:helix-turn-helix transcriptional regulator [Myxococcus sp. K38C18041901]|uniref:AraC family transcriptional regulator n=1 Tax=Myxococcus guangdongensis TaxID=2906760 RepID=UPI0020A725A7|nr:helix-turn-helix transcriptional regulator [Myxococcus guangdongensis]MCP3061234.1 helix-turn-helix transcriptional regulator [Myxococcus guangdongensis]